MSDYTHIPYIVKTAIASLSEIKEYWGGVARDPGKLLRDIPVAASEAAVQTGITSRDSINALGSGFPDPGDLWGKEYTTTAKKQKAEREAGYSKGYMDYLKRLIGESDREIKGGRRPYRNEPLLNYRKFLYRRRQDDREDLRKERDRMQRLTQESKNLSSKLPSIKRKLKISEDAFSHEFGPDWRRWPDLKESRD